MSFISDHVAYALPHVRPVLQDLRARILQLGDDVVEKATSKQRIGYWVARIFAEVKVQKKCVLVRFFETCIADPKGAVEHIEHAAANDWQHDKEVRIFKTGEIDYAMRFIEASYRSHRARLAGR